MNTKILTYSKTTLNKIVDRIEVLTHIKDNIYTYAEDSNLKNLVIKINNIYIDFGLIDDYSIKHNIYRIEQVANEPFLYIENLKRPNSLHIELYKRLGLNTNKLIERRDNYDKAKKLEEELAEEKKLNDKKIKNQIKDKEARESLNNLKDGKDISFAELSNIINTFNINMHPRKKGLINRLAQNKSCFISKERGAFDKKTSNQTVQNIFYFIKENILHLPNN